MADIILNIENCYNGSIDCNCSLSFDSYLDNQIAKLSVGNLVAEGCIITDYTIEWYLNDEVSPQFITGNVENTDPNIVFFHPFTGNASLVVQDGEWTAQVRYVTIDGQKVYAFIEQGEPYCELLQNQPPIYVLPQITVSTLDCVATNTTGDYSYQITYNGTNPNPELASRTLNYYIGGTINYFAFSFQGFFIADRIKISYVDVTDELNPIELCDFAVGKDNTETNYSLVPIRIDEYIEFKQVLDLTSFVYTSGNYLLIEVSPSFVDINNTNTNWVLKTKCLETFDCTTCDPSIYDIDPYETQLMFDELNCVYVARIRNVGDCAYNGDFYKYLMSITSSVNTNSYRIHPSSSRGATYELDFLQNTDASLLGSKAFNILSCTNFVGTMLLSKVSNVYTLDFIDETDYLLYKNEYLSALNGVNISNYDPDDTNINYYKLITSIIRIGTTCGDNFTTRYIEYHPSGSIVYDDINFIITITVLVPTNAYTDSECNNTYETAESIRTSITNRLLNDDYSILTGCKYTSAVGTRYLSISPISELVQTAYINTTIHSVNAEAICGSLVSKGFCLSGTTFPIGLLQIHNVKIQFTGTEDYTSRFDNFKIIDLRDINGCYNAVGTVVYEKASGVITTPALSDSPTLLRQLLMCYNFNNNREDSHNLYNSSTFSSAGILTYVTGKVTSNAIHFNGSAYLSDSMRQGNFNNNGQYTISCWFTTEDISITRTIGGKYVLSPNIYIYLKLVGGKIGLYATDSLGNADVCLSTTTIIINTWYHVVVVRDGYDIKLYLNGVLETTVTSTNLGRFVLKASTTIFGSALSGENWLGDINQFAFWARALCANEILSLNNSGNGLVYENFNTIIDVCP